MHGGDSVATPALSQHRSVREMNDMGNLVRQVVSLATPTRDTMNANRQSVAAPA
jgi:hypothetical protein